MERTCKQSKIDLNKTLSKLEKKEVDYWRLKGEYENK